MRLPLMMLFLFLYLDSREQDRPFDKYSSDTLHLPDFTAPKFISYDLGPAVIYVDYKNFMKDFTVLYKRYKQGMRGLKKEKLRGDYINPDYEPRFRLLDSIYRLLEKQVRLSDTCFLSQTTFTQFGLGEMMSFDKVIENGHCIVFDKNRNRQRTIIRQKGYYVCGSLCGWGGRRYFFIGQPNSFLSATDWVS